MVLYVHLNFSIFAEKRLNCKRFPLNVGKNFNTDFSQGKSERLLLYPKLEMVYIQPILETLHGEYQETYTGGVL